MSMHYLTPLTSPSDTSLCRRLVLSWKTSDSEIGGGSVSFGTENFAVSLCVNKIKWCKLSKIQKPQLIDKMYDKVQDFYMGDNVLYHQATVTDILEENTHNQDTRN